MLVSWHTLDWRRDSEGKEEDRYTYTNIYCLFLDYKNSSVSLSVFLYLLLLWSPKNIDFLKMKWERFWTKKSLSFRMSGSQIPCKTKHDTVDVGYFSHPNVPSEVSIEISGDENFMISHSRVLPLSRSMSYWSQKNEPSSTIVTLYTLWISRKIYNSCIKRFEKGMGNRFQKSAIVIRFFSDIPPIR